MITKSGANFAYKQTAKQTKLAAMVTAHQRNFAGGGAKKKPPMPATETDFDIVFVGITTFS